MTPADIDTVQARIRAATGPDRELDADIDVTLLGGETVWKQTRYTGESYPASRRPSATHVGGFANEYVPLYTASLDGALALMEKMFGHTAYQVGRDIYGNDYASIWLPGQAVDGSPHHFASGKAKAPSLALLAALFSAMKEKSDANA